MRVGMIARRGLSISADALDYQQTEGIRTSLVLHMENDENDKLDLHLSEEGLESLMQACTFLLLSHRDTRDQAGRRDISFEMRDGQPFTRLQQQAEADAENSVIADTVKGVKS